MLLQNKPDPDVRAHTSCHLESHLVTWLQYGENRLQLNTHKKKGIWTCFPWHSTRDKAETVHSYRFIHLLLTPRKPTQTPVDSSLFFGKICRTRQDCCSPRKNGKLKSFAQKSKENLIMHVVQQARPDTCGLDRGLLIHYLVTWNTQTSVRWKHMLEL